jgi:multicomponent Na+:H+ antiporter subunit D
MVLPTAAMVALGLAIAVAGGPLYAFSQRAAADLLQPANYIQAVLTR